MKELLLVVTIAGERVALPAAAVESVVELDTLTPVPRAAPHVAGLSALRSRVLTVIDCMRSLELGDTDCSDGIREAAVVEVDGHHYALIVDLVESGATLRENGLVELETICPISSVLVANPSLYKLRHAEIAPIVERLRQAVAGA